jgi:hypothetical protein
MSDYGGGNAGIRKLVLAGGRQRPNRKTLTTVLWAIAFLLGIGVAIAALIL